MHISIYVYVRAVPAHPRSFQRAILFSCCFFPCSRFHSDSTEYSVCYFGARRSLLTFACLSIGIVIWYAQITMYICIPIYILCVC